MAKATTEVRKQNKINLDNLSARDQAILSLDTQTTMKKYNMGKQGVYDRRFALNKKIKEAGLTVEQVTGSKPTVKKVQPKMEETPVEPAQASQQATVQEKNVPVIMKPVEINFENFTIKVNGMPKRISVNPETNAIEIDI
ncbi:MAG: hypothetical protein JWQ40_5044 [Segetibacter sp.]|jgi:hypothetical protein|nr:hypothetical protein [Segetibacter sp.]